jgi:hypothetical protein
VLDDGRQGLDDLGEIELALGKINPVWFTLVLFSPILRVKNRMPLDMIPLPLVRTMSPGRTRTINLSIPPSCGHKKRAGHMRYGCLEVPGPVFPIPFNCLWL